MLKFKMRYWSFFILLMVFSMSVQAQGNQFKTQRGSGGGRISGEILDGQSGEAVEFATVVLTESATAKDIDGTITDETGKFSFYGVRPGNYKITLTFIGYQPQEITDIKITAKTPAVELGEIQMSVDGVVLGEVEVTAQAGTFRNEIDKLVYNPGNDLVNAGGTASDVLSKDGQPDRTAKNQ